MAETAGKGVGMRQTFTFAGRVVSDFGVYISGSGIFNAPEREYEPIEIPGRNGALLGPERRLANIELTYPAFCYANFKQNIANLKSYLLSKTGYQRLTDTYYPEEFRLAYYAGGLEADMVPRLNAGSFDITFICKPQRYLVSGENVITLTSSGTITNPTNFEAQPLIRVYGSGSITVNGTKITISTTDSYTDIDCEMMEAYYGTSSRNDKISLNKNNFPVLSSGKNTITLTGVTKAEIKPRWWRV